MWISKNEYNFFKMLEKQSIENKNLLEEVSNMYRLNSERTEELCKIREKLKYYLDTNEEKGVVYIPKFVVEKMVYGK